jgi:hypothetical protein
VLLQTKPALCTGLKSGAVEVSNSPLPAQDEAKWAKVSCSILKFIIKQYADALYALDKLHVHNSKQRHA